MSTESKFDKIMDAMQLPTDAGTPIIHVKPLQYMAVGHVAVSDEFMATDGVFTYTVFASGTAIVKCQNIAVVNDSSSKDMEEAVTRIDIWRRRVINRMANGGNQQ